MGVASIRRELREFADIQRAEFVAGYFKTGPGQYGEGDRFLGVPVPAVRRLARTHREAAPADIEALLHSRWHEERALALLILVERFKTAQALEREKIFRFYLANTRHINNWDLVDISAEHLIGAHERCDMKLLARLAKSQSLWERRIAVLASRTSLKRGDFAPTLELARMLLTDSHDLIHKAVGWMLREIADRDRATLETFLGEHGKMMPRTMLRYAIEKFPPALRRKYLVTSPASRSRAKKTEWT